MGKEIIPTTLLRVFVKKGEGERIKRLSKSNGHPLEIRFCISDDLTGLLNQEFIEGKVNSIQGYSDGREVPKRYRLYALFFKPQDAGNSRKVADAPKSYLRQVYVKEGGGYTQL